jgi:hypothetical protein
MIVSIMSEMLTEVATAPVKAGKRWRVKIATPGQGSSGYYSADVLREYGPVAIPAGTKAFLGHAKPQDRSLRDLVGTYPDGAFWVEEENALFADLQPATKKWADVLDELGPLAGASISVSGSKDAQGNVLTMEYHRANSVDLVPEPGLEGSGLQEQIESLIESARFDSEKPGVTSASTEKEIMDNKEILEGFAALKTLVETLIAKIDGKTQVEAQAKVDAEALDAAVTEALTAFDAKRALIESVELLPSQRASLIEQARSGADVAPLIEQAKKVFDEAKSAVLTESEVGRGFTSPTEDWNVSGVRF